MKPSQASPLSIVEDALVQAMQEVIQVLEGPPSPNTEVEKIAELIRVVEALPISSALYCQAHGWLASAKELMNDGERKAAIYQVRLICRKLALNLNL